MRYSSTPNTCPLVKEIGCIWFGELDTVNYAKVTRTAVHGVATLSRIAGNVKFHGRKASWISVKKVIYFWNDDLFGRERI
jgi:hypothetical protein